MSNTATVDAAPKATGDEHVDSIPSTGLDRNGLAELFSRPVSEDVSEEEKVASVTEEVEKPASNPDTESEPEEENSLTDDESQEESVEEEQPEAEAESEAKEKEEDEEPEWFRKRIDKITAQRRQAEERVEALEKKLEEKESQEKPVDTVDQVMDLTQLETLEKQATEAEDQVDELLEQEPKYDDDGEAYWKVGEQKLTRPELIEIRKNARNAFRAIPHRREFLQRKKEADAQLEGVSFFKDREDPYYEFAQQTLKSPIYLELENKIPDAKAFIALAIAGKISLDEKAEEKKKQVIKKAAPKTTPKGKAATDTGTAVNPETPEDGVRKRKKKILSSGNVDRNAAVELFR